MDEQREGVEGVEVWTSRMSRRMDRQIEMWMDGQIDRDKRMGGGMEEGEREG